MQATSTDPGTSKVSPLIAMRSRWVRVLHHIASVHVCMLARVSNRLWIALLCVCIQSRQSLCVWVNAGQSVCVGQVRVCGGGPALSSLEEGVFSSGLWWLSVDSVKWLLSWTCGLLIKHKTGRRGGLGNTGTWSLHCTADWMYTRAVCVYLLIAKNLLCFSHCKKTCFQYVNGQLSYCHKDRHLQDWTLVFFSDCRGLYVFVCWCSASSPMRVVINGKWSYSRWVWHPTLDCKWTQLSTV